MSFSGCRLCYKNSGYLYKKDKNNELYVEKCNCLIEYQKKEYLKIQLKKANLPEDFLNFSIKTYKGNLSLNNIKILEYYIQNFKDFKNYHMYFYGDYGTQKSTVSKYIILELLKKNYTGYYILAKDLISYLLQDRDIEIQKKLIDIINVDILVIDELSDDKCTIYKSEYQIPFLISFLKNRLESIKKSTIFLSNNSIESLHNSKFGIAISDIINRECKEKLLFQDNYYSLKKEDLNTISKIIEKRMKNG